MVAYSKSALKLLDISVPSDAKQLEDFEQQLADVLSGNVLLPGSEPYAHCYCGHQFGSFAGQLGDGAAIYLGEVFLDFCLFPLFPLLLFSLSLPHIYAHTHIRTHIHTYLPGAGCGGTI